MSLCLSHTNKMKHCITEPFSSENYSKFGNVALGNIHATSGNRVWQHGERQNKYHNDLINGVGDFLGKAKVCTTCCWDLQALENTSAKSPGLQSPECTEKVTLDLKRIPHVVEWITVTD